MSAVAFISGILIHEKYIAIDFARKEIAGNAYFAETRGALLDLASSPSTAIAPAVLQRHAATVLEAEQRHGPDMGSAELNRSFHDALTALGSTPASASPSAAIDKGRELLTRVGNLSNLILDPDLDSYYTMSIVLLRAPELLSAVTGITAHVEQLDRGRPGTRRGGARPFPASRGTARRGPPGPRFRLRRSVRGVDAGAARPPRGPRASACSSRSSAIARRPAARSRNRPIRLNWQSSRRRTARCSASSAPPGPGPARSSTACSPPASTASSRGCGCISAPRWRCSA